MEKCLPKKYQRPGQGKALVATQRRVSGAGVAPGAAIADAAADAGRNRLLLRLNPLPPSRDRPDVSPVPSAEADRIVDAPQPVFSETIREEPPVAHDAPAPAPVRPPPSTPAARASVQDAIDHVNHILANLRETLEEMEDVLEMLEAFERQGDADEREIESLRRTLRHLQRPRDGGQSHRGHS